MKSSLRVHISLLSLSAHLIELQSQQTFILKYLLQLGHQSTDTTDNLLKLRNSFVIHIDIFSYVAVFIVFYLPHKILSYLG